jgi:hypothetical protein
MTFHVGDRVRAIHDGEGEAFGRDFQDKRGTVTEIEGNNYCRVRFDNMNPPRDGTDWRCRNNGLVLIHDKDEEMMRALEHSLRKLFQPMEAP